MNKTNTDYTLVIVTCYKDSWQFELLCNTMQKFLEPCPVLIVCNEEPLFEVWKDWFNITIAEKLSKFDILVKQRSDFLLSDCYSIPGWITQQSLKLAACKYVKTNDYIVLDSKNFFTQDIGLNQIKRRTPLLLTNDNLWYNAVHQIYNHFKIQIPENIYLTDNVTPFFLNNQIVKSLIDYFGGADNIPKILTGSELGLSIAEFYLYGVYEQLFNRQDNIVYDNDHFYYNVLIIDHLNAHKSYTYSDSKIFGLHRYLFYVLEEHDIHNLLCNLNCSDCIPNTPSPSSRFDIPLDLYFASKG